MPELLERQYDVFEAMQLQYEIDFQKLLMEYKYDTDILDGSYFSEGKEENQKNTGDATPNKFTTFVNSLVARIKRFANDIIEMLTSVTTKQQGKVDVKAFKNSSTGQAEMEKIYRQAESQANQVYAEGNNIITRIMSSVGCPSEVIHSYTKKVAGVSNFCKQHKNAIKVGVIGTGIIGAYRLHTKTSADTIELASKKALEKLDEPIPQTDEEKAEAAKKLKEEQVQTVLSAMSQLYSDVSGMFSLASKVKN